ncbi:MAG: MaoC/PaaZ C-terminal domain-containing protein [Candidatus Binataceae bacterium]
MSIDLEKALGAELPETWSEWGAEQVILYHLGLGAGDPPTAPGELSYTYEEKLKVLPTFGTIALHAVLLGLLEVPGLIIDLAKLLSLSHDLEIFGPVPAAGRVRHSGRITGIYDEGWAAVVAVELESETAEGPIWTDHYSFLLRDQGGFGGIPAPQGVDALPPRAPDRVVELASLPQQALLYRLTGDRNPIHIDPGFAREAGLPRPILHGLCSYGMVCKAVVDEFLGGDPAGVARYAASFSGVVFPGETIVTSLWKDKERVAIKAEVKERGTPVLSHASIILKN